MLGRELESCPLCEVRRHWISREELASFIDNCPHDPCTHLPAGVRIVDGKALFAVKDSVDFQELLVIITVIPKNCP